MLRHLHLFLTLVGLIFLAACGGDSETATTETSDNTSTNAATTALTVSARDLDIEWKRILAPSGATPLMDRVRRVELAENAITITGTFQTPDGQFLTGSFTHTLTVTDGQITSTITEVAMEGLTADDPRFAEFNEIVARRIVADFISPEDNQQVTFESIAITPDGLTGNYTIR